MQPTDDSTERSAGDAQLPPHLEQRFAEEKERFHHSQSVDEDVAAASKRHDAILKERVQHAHEEVEHAKQVAASHPHGSSGATGPIEGSGLAVPTEPGMPVLGELSREVQEKQRQVQQQQQELSDLDARLARAAQAERDLRARLGETV